MSSLNPTEGFRVTPSKTELSEKKERIDAWHKAKMAERDELEKRHCRDWEKNVRDRLNSEEYNGRDIGPAIMTFVKENGLDTALRLGKKMLDAKDIDWKSEKADWVAILYGTVSRPNGLKAVSNTDLQPHILRPGVKEDLMPMIEREVARAVNHSVSCAARLTIKTDVDKHSETTWSATSSHHTLSNPRTPPLSDGSPDQPRRMTILSEQNDNNIVCKGVVRSRGQVSRTCMAPEAPMYQSKV